RGAARVPDHDEVGDAQVEGRLGGGDPRRFGQPPEVVLGPGVVPPEPQLVLDGRCLGRTQGLRPSARPGGPAVLGSCRARGHALEKGTNGPACRRTPGLRSGPSKETHAAGSAIGQTLSRRSSVRSFRTLPVFSVVAGSKRRTWAECDSAGSRPHCSADLRAASSRFRSALYSPPGLFRPPSLHPTPALKL